MRALQFTLAFLLILGPLLFRFPAREESFSPSINALYYYPFEGDPSPLPNSWVKESVRPFNAVWIPNGDASRLILPNRRVDLNSEKMAFAPIHGDGYFIFQRVGSKISFLSSLGELLWKKPFPAYPVTAPSGSPVFLMTGDANRVDVLDASGNLKGVKHIAGNFLTDYKFSRSGRTCFVFGAGGLIVIDPQGEIAFKFESQDPAFYKSCALSPDGQVAAVHALRGESDVVFVVRQKEKKASVSETLPLSAEYTHSLPLAVSNSGSVLVIPPEGALFFKSGDLVWKSNEPAGLAYAFSDESFLAFATGTRTEVIDANGNRIARIPSPFGSGEPYQILPGPRKQQFLLQSYTGLVVFGFVSE